MRWLLTLRIDDRPLDLVSQDARRNMSSTWGVMWAARAHLVRCDTIFCWTMRRLTGILILITAGANVGQAKHQTLAFCVQDASMIRLPEEGPGAVEVPGINNLVLRGTGAGDFELRREAKSLYTFRIEDFNNENNANGVVVWAPGGDAFAIDYSDGGAIGNFHVRVFTVQADKVTDATSSITPAVREFASRHYCKARGNNITALKWVDGSRQLLLLAEIYPTSDCGADLAHVEGYLVSVPGGRILKHLSLAELKRYPGVCLENSSDQ